MSVPKEKRPVIANLLLIVSLLVKSLGFECDMSDNCCLEHLVPGILALQLAGFRILATLIQ